MTEADLAQVEKDLESGSGPFANHAANLLTTVRHLRWLLKQCQWFMDTCPICKGWQKTEESGSGPADVCWGHTPDCPLAAALR